MYSVTVRIAGEEHVIRANAEPEYTKDCARFVDERISEIRRQAGLIEGHKAAILAALSITDEFFQAKLEMTKIRGDLATSVNAAAERLSAGLAEPAEDGGPAT
jgi:cell division protein ZapA (FtsZ GTPase activity inhibitor)